MISSTVSWNSVADVVCGLLIMIFAALSLSPRNGWAQWTNACLGVWLLAAPLLFWTPSAAVYTSDTLVGALVIAFTILVPMMPGMSMEGMMDETDVPPGWTYSPSTYLQRLPIIALGCIGFVLARILTVYQLGHIDAVWEPFFGGDAARNGTEYIITSNVSKACPVADGGLGAELHGRDPDGRHGRSRALAHHAVDGAALRHRRRAARRDQHLLHHHPADRHRHLLHYLPASWSVITTMTLIASSTRACGAHTRPRSPREGREARD
jgi:hypothetical protein